jgi:error-prone DNA polymerase
MSRVACERWLPALLAAADSPVRLPVPAPLEKLALDRAALGLAPGRHVLTYLRPDLRHRPLRRAEELAALPTATVVEVVGQVIARQQPPTAKGVLFLGLSDETGLLNVVVPPSVYQRDRTVVRGEALLWVTGVLERWGAAQGGERSAAQRSRAAAAGRGGGPTVRATQLRPLAAIPI